MTIVLSQFQEWHNINVLYIFMPCMGLLLEILEYGTCVKELELRAQYVLQTLNHHAINLATFSVTNKGRSLV